MIYGQFWEIWQPKCIDTTTVRCRTKCLNHNATINNKICVPHAKNLFDFIRREISLVKPTCMRHKKTSEPFKLKWNYDWFCRLRMELEAFEPGWVCRVGMLQCVNSFTRFVGLNSFAVLLETCFINHTNISFNLNQS